MWPFKEKIETRTAQPFTDAIAAAIIAQASGNVPSNPLTLAALEMAAGAYMRAFMGATVEGSAMVKKALTSGTLGLVARDLIRRGESIHLILTDSGELELIPCGSWDVRGHWTEESWEYRVDLFGPSGNITRLVPSFSVIHCRYSYDPARPWHGISPLGWASSSGNLAANLENRLEQESGGPVGYLLPVPTDSSPKEDGTGPLDMLRKDINALKGQNVLTETTAAAWGEGKQNAPMNDWKPNRVGANPPEVLAVLRSDMGRAVLGACGVPVGLFESQGSSQGAREAYRQFVYLSVQPLAKMVSEELSKKLETEVSLNFSELQAHDLAARAGSFKKMVESGIAVDRAAGLSGLLALEEA